MPVLTFVAAVTALLYAMPLAGAPIRLVPRRASDPHVAVPARPNDNRAAVGTLRHGRLDVRLVAGSAIWHPEGRSATGVPLRAFAEEGHDPVIPGPLIRVPAGTEVRVVLRNDLNRALWVRGLQDRGAAMLDPVRLAPGETREVRFRATVPGTFYYWGRTTDSDLLDLGDDSQLVGALVIDPPGVTPPPDRIMVITAWEDSLRVVGKPVREHELLVVNGLSWPNTERLRYTVGDSVRWRVINASTKPHPMHLHGFYYRVDSRGDAVRDTVYTDQQQRRVVTEFLVAGNTMSMTWSPTRPGNWLFHCHLVKHIDAALRMSPHGAGHEANHALDGMAGLVMGIHVAPRRGAVALTEPEPQRRLRLYVTERPRVFGDRPGFSFILQEGSAPPADDSVRFPSSALVLRRGEPVEITVLNRTSEMTGVHWHGIEVASFYDGVAGWSGAGANVAPVIAPRDSFVVRMTPDRAGTFIYHTHANEMVQLASGLYGVLLIAEPGAGIAPGDRVLLLGDGGPSPIAVPFVNGQPTGALNLDAGARHRIRVVNISTVARKRIRLYTDSTLANWRPLAKDGAELPPSQATSRAADVRLGPGETIDLEIAGAAGRPMALDIQTLRKAPIQPLTYRMPVVIH